MYQADIMLNTRREVKLVNATDTPASILSEMGANMGNQFSINGSVLSAADMQTPISGLAAKFGFTDSFFLRSVVEAQNA